MSKSIDINKTVYELCSENPQIATILAEIGFKDVTKPGMLNTAGRFMTIHKGAAMKKIEIEVIKQTFLENGYEMKE